MQGASREAAMEARKKLEAELLEDNPRQTQAGLQEALRPDEVAKRLKQLEQRIAARQNQLGGDIDDIEVCQSSLGGEQHA